MLPVPRVIASISALTSLNAEAKDAQMMQL